MIDKTIMKHCYKILKLDERASRQEVELAYDVLMHNSDNTPEQSKNYRFAFEYLMANIYCTAVDNEQEKIEELTNDIIATMPDEVEDALNIIEQEGEEIGFGSLTDKIKVMWSTMKVNLPLLYVNIKKNCYNFFGFRIWTEKKISNIIKMSCLNPLEYENMSFIIESEYEDEDDIMETKRLYRFVKSIKDLYKNNGLCQEFKISRNKNCIYGSVIAEKDTQDKIQTYLKSRISSDNYSFMLYIMKG